MVRPRGWHLPRSTCSSTASRSPASLFDFGLFFFHNARELLDAGHGPVLLPAKMESHLEARLWNDVFVHAQDALGLPRGTIKATVLIETLPAAFEMDEILYELREHSAGLNCGRWDYIFSFIKKFARHDPACVLPDRAQVTMDQALPARLLAAADQDLPPPRRARDGRHGGADPDQGRPGGQRRGARARCAPTSSARSATATTAPGSRIPGLVPVARKCSTRTMPAPNQLDRQREDVHVDGRRPARGARRARVTEAGLRHEHARRHPVPRGLAARHRLRAALQPDGRRRHRRDLARAGLAVDPPPARALDDGRKVTRELFRADRCDEELGEARDDARRDAIRRPATSSGAASCSTTSSTSDELRRSS